LRKEKSKLAYFNIVVDNFFIYLDRKAITQKKYALDNNIDQSLLSKWKKGDSSPTLDQVKQAAKYFNVTVNDLVYTEKEKKHLEVLADKSYDPILAQQSVKVKLYRDFFKKPLIVFLSCIIIFALIIFIIILLKDNSPYFSLIIVLGIFLSLKVIYINSFEDKTFIINYLDDIFYRRKDSENKFYKWSIVIRVLSLLTAIYYSTLFVDLESATNTQKGFLTTLMVLLMFLAFGSIIAITELPRKFKLEIYDNEIGGYNSSRLFLLIHFAIFAISILLNIYYFQEYLPFLIISFIMLGLNVFDYIKISLEYSKYVLVYQENDKNPRELFPKKN